MSRLRRAVRATAIVQIFGLVGSGLSLVTVPLYLRWLGTERYGLMLTALACTGYLMFSDAGLSWSSMLLIAHAAGRGDREEIARIVRCSASLAGLSILIAGTVAVIGWAVMSSDLGPAIVGAAASREAPGLCLAIGAQVGISLLMSAFYNLFQGLQDGHWAALYQAMGRFVGIGASLTAAWAGWSLGGVLGASTAGVAVGGLSAAIHGFARYRWAFQRGPWWDREQVRRQCRTGMKSFGLQIGRALSASASVLALSSQAGAAAVPPFTVASTLLNVPLGAFTSFNSNLQSAYGEAAARGELAWAGETLRAILRHLLLAGGLLTAGFVTFAAPFIEGWTGGKLNPGAMVLASALAVSGATVMAGVFQFALSGLNRHRAAAGAEVVHGLLCLVFAPLAVRWMGPGAVGLAILGSALLTNLRVGTREARSHLGLERVWPPASFFWRVLLAATLAAAAGAGAWRAFNAGRDGLHGGAALAAGAGGALLVAVLYVLAVRWLLPQDVRPMLARVAGLLARWRRPTPVPQ